MRAPSPWWLFCILDHFPTWRRYSRSLCKFWRSARGSLKSLVETKRRGRREFPRAKSPWACPSIAYPNLKGKGNYRYCLHSVNTGIWVFCMMGLNEIELNLESWIFQTSRRFVGIPVVCPLQMGVSKHTSARLPLLTCSSLLATLEKMILELGTPQRVSANSAKFDSPAAGNRSSQR